MSYEQPDVQTYSWGSDTTFGATGVTHYIVGPKGKVGFVREVMVDVTTSLVGTTTVPEIDVGISSGDYTFGRYRLGTSASVGYAVGPHSASQEAITGNPPRTLADFTGHVVLDGGPLTSSGIAGGSYGTQLPAGRIPASGWAVTNVISGTSGVCRVYLNGMLPAKDLTVGQSVTVQGVLGATGATGVQKISAIDTSGAFAWIELSGTTFGGTYTSGGDVYLNVVVTCLAGTGGTPTGGGYVRVKVQWIGSENP
jgi:hypothetical protein